MADATTAPQSASHTHSPTRQRNRRQRGGGRQGTRETHPPVNQGVLALRPASLAPASSQALSAEASSAEQSATEPSSGNRGRTRRNRQGNPTNSTARPENTHIGHGHARARDDGRRGVGASDRTHIAGRRRFGSELTTDTQDTSLAQDTGLQADAPEFVPGQQHQSRRRRPKRPIPSHAPGPRPRAGSIQKSNAEDIMTRTQEDIASGAYECLICSESVHRMTKIWTCHTCWAVLHLGCIKKWSSNEAATVSVGRLQDGQLPPPRQWRCPGCNLPQDGTPDSYECWCGKETDPTSIPGLPPHSCGQSCGKEKVRPKRCPHVCDLVCHAGPCPPCTAIGPEQTCFCGKQSSRKQCVETNYDQGFSCGQVCDEPMPCGDPEHTCQKPCHEGLCGACEVPLDAKCYCGQTEKVIMCNDKEIDRLSTLLLNDGTTEQWTGIFQCGRICNRELDCGEHACQQSCHVQGVEKGHHCPRSVDVVSHCTCGKTPLEELGVTRQSCTDPIPACDKVCDKNLVCGHRCSKVCHVGDCPPCLEQVDVDCVCGRTHALSLCHQGYEAKPLCPRICRTTLNCGRHACEQHCCSGEKRASERLATKRKHRPLGSAPVREDFESEHICVRQCGRPLGCGDPDHTCQELCHKGKCNTCPNAIFEDVSCHCGRTVLFPPLPCGTRPPPCRYQCQRPNPCTIHPPVQHNCHGDDESCPKCPFLTAKKCMCGKRTLKNQPCFSANVSCGSVCGNLLRCGEHYCRKTCHAPGQCEDANGQCTQPCGKPKSACGHPDLVSCHAGSACREDKPCQSKMVITCDCARLRVETKCLASKHGEGNLSKKLSCDDECARQARNRQLAQALQVDSEDRANDHVPYETATLRLYQQNGKFAVEHEEKLRIFAADTAQRRLRFSPMSKAKRGFIHALATDFGFESESLDPEPHRHVIIFKTPRFVSAPIKTIADCIRIRARQGKLKVPEAVSSANVSDAENALASDERVPYNGFVVSNPRFGLTVDELQHELFSVFRLAPSLAFDIAFLPNEEVILKAKPSNPSTTLAPEIVQSGLKGLKSSITGMIVDKKLAGSVGMCVLDSSLNVKRRELDATSVGGWSTVAKGLSRPMMIPKTSSAGVGSRFLVLGKKKAGKTPLPAEEKHEDTVVDDWEEEMDKEYKASQSQAEAASAEDLSAEEKETHPTA